LNQLAAKGAFSQMKSKKVFQIVRAWLVWILLSLATLTPASAAGFDCDDVLSRASTETDCRRHWVENQEVRFLHWYQGPDEYSISIEGRTPFFNIRSPRPPYLTDLDGDRFADLVFFSLLGMVNGDYEFHRFDPQSGTFEQMGKTTGSSYYINRNGIFVTVARSSCCESGASIHQIIDNNLVPVFQMAIRLQEISTPETQCQIFSEGPLSRADIERDYADLIEAFCDYYQNTEQAAVKAWEAELPSSHFELPDGTAFFCVLEGGVKAITIEERDQGFAYMFGGVGLAPDLELYRSDNIVAMENADRSIGPLTGSISYKNGDYTYTLHSPRNAFGVVGTDERLYRLTAQLEDQEEYIFDQTCQPQAVHDFTFLWIAG
jgi:hypothetical protein